MAGPVVGDSLPAYAFAIFADEMRRRSCDSRTDIAPKKHESSGGPHNGLLVPVKEKDGDFVYPDVMDFSSYTFDPEAWEFQYTPEPRPRLS